MLDAAKRLGFEIEVNDEGDYYQPVFVNGVTQYMTFMP